MDPVQISHVLEACLLVAGKPMTVAQLEQLFGEDEGRPARDGIVDALKVLQGEYEGRGIELVEVASGWRLQSRAQMEPWVSRLFQERAPRYSRALLETLVLVAYRQPITRGEIEDVRGVAVSSNIIKTLQEREWVREVGHKDVPGKPALLGTTKQFLDYFNLKRLEDLPPLGELKDIEALDAALAAEIGDLGQAAAGDAANDDAEGDESGESVESADSGAAVEADGVDADGEISATGDDKDSRAIPDEVPELDGSSAVEQSARPSVFAGASAPGANWLSATEAAAARADSLAQVDASDSTDAVAAEAVGEAAPVDPAGDADDWQAAEPSAERVVDEEGGPDSGPAAEPGSDVGEVVARGDMAQEEQSESLGTLASNNAELTLSDGAEVNLEAFRQMDSEADAVAADSEGSHPAAETWDDPQARLRQVVDSFAAEHRDQLKAEGRWKGNDGPSDEAPASSNSAGIDADAPDRDDSIP